MNPHQCLAWTFGCGCLLLGWVMTHRAQGVRFQDPGSARFCPPLEIGVVADDPADFLDACRGLQDALNFFRTHGLNTSLPATLEIVPKMPEEAGSSAVACYTEQQKRILILTYAEFMKRKSWFNVPISRELYRSLAAHEVAHALAACNFRVSKPSLQAQEYVAYAAMFAMMHPDLRSRILRAVPGTGFASEIEITAIFYLMDPFLFGAESYRHFMKEENGTAFLQLVFAGKVLSD